MYYVYLLRHPLTKAIRYVGITSVELETRLSGHINYKSKSLKKSWIDNLVLNNLTPIIEINYIVPTKQEALEYEKILIKGLINDGEVLLNKVNNHARRSKRLLTKKQIKEKYPNITPEEYMRNFKYYDN